MADPQKLEIIQKGVIEWNRSRVDFPNHPVDLQGADLRGMNLSRANFYNANLTDAQLQGALLYLTTLRRANLTRANLTGANLECAHMVDTVVDGAVFTGCKVYGISSWNLIGTPKDQTCLIITSEQEPDTTEWVRPEVVVTVDDLQTAQFMHLWLKNENVRNILDTTTSKVVLLLGNFKKERKDILQAIQEKLRTLNFTPVIFDFKHPDSKDNTCTIETLAHLSCFIIADLTDPSSVPYELGTIVPQLHTTPVLPLKKKGSKGFSMIEDLQRSYPSWVLDTHYYKDQRSLIDELPQVIAPANERVKALKAKAK